MIVELSPEQKEKIRKYAEDFLLGYLETKEFERDKEVALDRISFYKKELPERVKELSEVDIEEILSKLWSRRPWGLQYTAQRTIKENGIDRLQWAFEVLLDTSKDAHERYGEVVNKVKGLGPGIITEILTYIQPQECGIWNKKAREALKILGIDIIDVNKYQPSIEEYETYNKLLKSIFEELKEIKNVYSEKLGMILVHLFFYSIAQGVKFPQEVKTIQETKEIEKEFDHDEIRDLTRDIGLMLGFETSTEVQVAHGARVDVVWSARIGNLGLIKYVFEVHRRGSIDSLLMNLQKAKSNPTVQKVIAISDKEQLKKIEKESEGLPEEFRRNLEFWPMEEVLIVAENLESAMEIINRLNLTPE